MEGTPSTVDREFAEAGCYSVEKFGYFVQSLLETVSMMVTLHLQHYSIVDAHTGNIGVRMCLKNYLQSVERRDISLPPRSSPSGQDVVQQIIRVVHVDPERNETSKASRSNMNKYLSVCVEDWIFQIVELSKCDPTWQRASFAVDANLSGWVKHKGGYHHSHVDEKWLSGFTTTLRGVWGSLCDEASFTRHHAAESAGIPQALRQEHLTCEPNVTQTLREDTVAEQMLRWQHQTKKQIEPHAHEQVEPQGCVSQSQMMALRLLAMSNEAQRVRELRESVPENQLDQTKNKIEPQAHEQVEQQENQQNEQVELQQQRMLLIAATKRELLSTGGESEAYLSRS